MTSRASGWSSLALTAGQRGVVLDVLDPGGGQDLLPPGQFRRQGGQRPLGQVDVQVGDQAYYVGQVDAVFECAAAFVVDQDERHRVRAVPARQRCDQRLQQLGLACPGGAADQRVRSVLAQVDGERPVPAVPDYRDRGPAAGVPPGRDRLRGGRLQAEQVQQPARIRQPAVLAGAAHVPDRRDGPGQQLGPGGRDVLRPDLADGRLAHLLHGQRAVGLRGGHGLALCGQQSFISVQADAVHADLASLAQDLDGAGQGPHLAGPVEDHHDVADEVGPPGVMAGERLLPGGDDGLEFGYPGRDCFRVVADQCGAILSVGGPAVRQPPGPLPVGFPAEAGEDVQLHVLRAVQRGDLGEEPPAGGLGHAAGTRDAHHGPLRQRDCRGRVGDQPGLPAAVLIGDGVGQLHPRWLVGGANPQEQVIRVGAAAFP